MLNQQPQDISSYVNGTSMLANFVTPKINVGKHSGAFFGMSISGSSTNLVGKVIIEGAAEPSTGADEDIIWCPISSDTITNTIFASTETANDPFDITFTQAKYLRIRYIFTSGTGTATMKCDCYLKPL